MDSSTRQPRFAYIAGLLIAFAAFFALNKLFFAQGFQFFQGATRSAPLSFFLSYASVGMPVFAFVYFTNGQRVLAPLGFCGNAMKGMLFAFGCSIPMFVGFGIPRGFQVSIESTTFWFGCVFAALFEEVYYRGFFFGQLLRKTTLGFIPALVVPAVTFASLHLYQSRDPSTLAGIFLTTFLGAGLFAWLYCEWDFNLWVPMFLHFFMNFSWSLFDSVADNALGDVAANVYRALTVTCAIVGTLLYKRRRREPLAINRRVLWAQPVLPTH